MTQHSGFTGSVGINGYGIRLQGSGLQAAHRSEAGCWQVCYLQGNILGGMPMAAWNLISLYLAALITVYLTPGPDMVLVMTISSAKGFVSGMSAAFGLAGARFIHVFASGMGLAALFTRIPTLSVIFRIAGAGYLLMLAYTYARARHGNAETARQLSGTSDLPATRNESTSNTRNPFLNGFLTNILNPKALMFCSILLPQFLFSNTIPLSLQFFILGIILVVTGFLFDLTYAGISSTAITSLRQLKRLGPPEEFGRSGQREKLWQLVPSLVFAFLAVYLLITL